MNYKLIELIEQVSVKCGTENHNNISGINIQKRFMPSKNSGSNTSNYKIVGHNQFACNLMHVGRDEKIPIALNFDNQEIVVSPAYTVFRVIDTSIVNIDYLNMIFTSSEFDRYAWFCTDASIRGNLDWKRFLDIQLDLPPLDIQEKYVAIYKAMLANQKAYENGLEDLKLVCDATIENLQKTAPKQMIGDYIELFDIRNKNNEDFAFKGLSMENYFIDSIANSKGLDFTKYKVVYPNDFAAVLMKVGRDRRITIAQNTSSKNYMISSAYFTFKARETINSHYLMMVMSTTDFDLRCWFNSDSSVRGSLEWGRFCEVKIPIANEGFQNSLANIYKVYLERKEINERLKQQIKDICPILIAGAIKEANANA